MLLWGAHREEGASRLSFSCLAQLTPPPSRQALGEGLREEEGDCRDAFAGSC